MTQTKIGLTGVHGSGKTTKAKELLDYFIDANKTVFMVNEVARLCPYTLQTVQAQEWIWYEQIRQEKLGMAQNVDVIITDRTVMDNLIYYRDIIETIFHPTRMYFITAMRWWGLYREAVIRIQTYNQIIRLPLNLEWLQVDDPIRSKDTEYAKRIDKWFDLFIQKHVTNTDINIISLSQGN